MTSFLHPWALWIGAVAAAAPLVIHLLTRPRPVRRRLSTIRFVREVVRQRASRNRLRDFLILLARTVAILLLAVAVAQPQRKGPSILTEPDQGQRIRVVLLDASRSMDARDGSSSAFQLAKTTAAQYLKYEPGLSADLIVAGAAPRSVFDLCTANFESLRDELARTEVLQQELNVPRALARAAELLTPRDENDHRGRELIVVSDFQRTNWTRADFSVLPKETRIQLDSVAPAATPANVAILGAAVRPVAVGESAVRLEIELGNFTPSSRNLSLEVQWGGAAHRLETVARPGLSTVSETIRGEASPWTVGTVRLLGNEDSLPDDDSYPLCCRLRREAVVALITRQPASLRPSSSHHLRCALFPEKSEGAGSLSLDTIDPIEMDGSRLARADVAVLDHPGKLSEEAIRLLADQVRRGRGLLYVTAEPIDATNLKLLLDALGGSGMPVRFLPAEESRRALTIAKVKEASEPWSIFGPALPAVLGRLRLGGGLVSAVNPAAELTGSVLAEYNDGVAALVDARVAAGRVVVFNVDLLQSNLPQTGLLVPIAQELMQTLLRQDGASDGATCGEPLVARLPAEAGPAADLAIERVGDEGPAAPDATNRFGTITDEAIGPLWKWASAEEPGVYRIRRSGEDVFACSVTVPAEESRLEPIPDDVLTGRLSGGLQMAVRRVGDESRQRDDLWKWAVVGCLGCILAEWTALMVFRS